jgi:hypothetical protein
MDLNTTIYLKDNDEFTLDNCNNVFFIKNLERSLWIIGSYESFGPLFKAIDESLHQEKETYTSLQDRLLDSEMREDKLQEENEYLKEQLELRRQV